MHRLLPSVAIVLAAASVAGLVFRSGSAARGANPTATPTPIGAWLYDTSGEERVLLRGGDATVQYCGNPIRFADVRLRSSASYAAGPDVAATWQKYIAAAPAAAGAAVPGAVPPAAAAAAGAKSRAPGTRVDAHGRKLIVSAKTPKPDEIGAAITAELEAVNREIATEVLALTDPPYKASLAKSELLRLLARSQFLLGRAHSDQDCINAAKQLVRLPVPGASNLPPDYLRVADPQVNTLLRAMLLNEQASRLNWSSDGSLSSVVMDIDAALAVDRPTEAERLAHVQTLKALGSQLTAVKKYPGWKQWYTGTNRAAYDRASIKTDYALTVWQKSETDTALWTSYSDQRKLLAAWRSQLAGLDTSLGTTNIERYANAAPTFVLAQRVNCKGALGRSKAVKVSVVGSDPMAIDPKTSAPTTFSRDVVTVTCPAAASMSYGVGVASRSERHFIIGKGKNPGGTTAQNIIDSDLAGEQVPLAAYLGHWAILNGGAGGEISLTAGPSFDAQGGLSPGLFYGVSYARNRAAYLSTGFTLSKINQLSGGYSPNDVVTSDVTSAPTRSAWKNSFTVLFSFPIRTSGNDPQPASPAPTSASDPTPAPNASATPVSSAKPGAPPTSAPKKSKT